MDLPACGNDGVEFPVEFLKGRSALGCPDLRQQVRLSTFAYDGAALPWPPSPLLHSAFWLEHRMWGTATVGYHLVNILLHAASACLVVHLAKRLALPGAWLAGFVFALHPVCVEAVAWMSEQKSTLSRSIVPGSRAIVPEVR
jgi:hypothetical protein